MNDTIEPADGLSRRAAVALGLSLAAGSAMAQTPAKGPRVWMDMDQKELDDAYDQSKYAPNQALVLRRRIVESEQTRQRLGQPKRVAYGPTAIEGLDIWTTKAANAPVMVFVHGGAWRGGMARDYAFAAETFINAGAHLVLLDFNNVAETKGDLMPMADQVRRGIAWVVKNAANFGGDPARVYVSGHSSGAHLAGCALIADWQKDYGLPQDAIKGAILCSGMYDLRPARLSARSSYVAFSDAMEDALSTQRHLERIRAPVTLLHGTQETPEFMRQTRDFAGALKESGKPVRLVVGEGYNHFEMMETVGNPYGLFGRAALAGMKLAAE